MERPGEIEGADDRQVIEMNILAMPLIDLERDQPGAVAVGRVGHRFARAAMVTTAILDVPAFDLPILTRHPRSSLPFEYNDISDLRVGHCSPLDGAEATGFKQNGRRFASGRLDRASAARDPERACSVDSAGGFVKIGTVGREGS